MNRALTVVVITLACIAIPLNVISGSHVLWYRAGHTMDLDPLGFGLILFVLCPVVTVFVVTFIVLGFFLHGPRASRWTKIMFLSIAAGCIFTLVWPFIGGKPGGIRFLEGFAKRVEEDINIAEIREWTAEQMDDNSGSKEHVPPETIQRFSPGGFHTIDGAAYFHWGGGFFSFGLVVGPENMVIPDGDDFRQIKAVDSGVYVWAGG